MRSVILISPSDNEISCLFKQWEGNAQNMFMDGDKLNMVINKERIYIDYIENGRNDYDEEEINHINIGKLSFYSICYSDREIMKLFIQKSVFSQGSYIDNDFGRVVLVEELRKEEILNFIA